LILKIIYKKRKNILNHNYNPIHHFKSCSVIESDLKAAPFKKSRVTAQKQLLAHLLSAIFV
jgi:hypothetical protein